MRVLAWSAMPSVGRYVTGVGKHILHMINGLAERPGWKVRHLLTIDGVKNCDYTVPWTTIPMSRRTAEFLWRTFDYPRIDDRYRDLDWVYCPRELYIPVSKTPSAVTVHDLYHLE